MDEPRAQRTLVKSPPELWAEVSDVEALAGHLGAFGEIRITRLEPEATVAWEGDRARGTVELEPSGWGTKVTLTARIEGGSDEHEPEPAAAPAPVASEPGAAVEPAGAAPEPEPEPEPPTDADPEPRREPEITAAEPEPAKRRGLFARLFRRRRERPAPQRTDGAPGPEREKVGRSPHPQEPEVVAPPPPREPETVAPPPPRENEPEPPSPPAPAASERGRDGLDPERAEAILVGVLDDLGAAHHRPFSRG